MPKEGDWTLVLLVRIPIGIVRQDCPLACGLDDCDLRTVRRNVCRRRTHSARVSARRTLRQVDLDTAVPGAPYVDIPFERKQLD